MSPKQGSKSRWREKHETLETRDPAHDRDKGGPQDNSERRVQIGVGHKSQGWDFL